MHLDPRLRYQTMIRAIEEVIIPALPQDESAAQEQARLVVRNLSLMMSQSGRDYAFAAVRHRHAYDLLAALIALSPVRSLGAGKAALNRLANESAPVVHPSQAQLESCAAELSALADDIVSESFTSLTAADYGSVAETVIERASNEFTHERIWAKAGGLDAEADRLPPMEAVFRDD